MVNTEREFLMQGKEGDGIIVKESTVGVVPSEDQVNRLLACLIELEGEQEGPGSCSVGRAMRSSCHPHMMGCRLPTGDSSSLPE